MVLALGQQKLRYLVTPETNNYLQMLEIKEIIQSHKLLTKRKLDTKKIMISSLGYKTSIFDMMYDYKQNLRCTFEFKFNRDRCDILMVCKLPSGQIFAAFLI